MTTKSKRTHPLDRDGDGAPGGSLPGNQTAPMADAAGDDLANARTTPGDGAEKLEAIEREVDQANAAARDAAGWTRDDARLTGKLTDIGARCSDLSVEAVVESWTDQEAFTVETFADAMLAPGRHRNAEGEEVTAEGASIPLPDVLGEWEVHFEPDGHGDTFDAEQVAAAAEAQPTETKIIVCVPWRADITPEQVRAQLDERAKTAWGDRPYTVTASGSKMSAVLTDEELTARTGLAEDLLTIATPKGSVSVRREDARRLVDNRFLYKSAHGYSSNTHPPYIDAASAEALVSAGLAEWDPDAGSHGGVRVTSEARSILNRASAAF
ncbi:hypothetical protein SH203_02865 [Brevundimonas sp. SH203]|uniref:hypothetical protein n=1 Tax=Brevundimonas sp. SH203 TaxID=345167 RepID=UPI0009D20993|nr:hypothetical protein [Brevundimonas sp. SH203]GAW42449.1 hypothetical protein SH203_02865 [Brevundimonas sp. SH203]